MSDDLKLVLGIVLVILGVIILMVVILTPIMWANCNAATASIGFPHRFDFWAGCMIEPKPGQWIPLENWRLFEQ